MMIIMHPGAPKEQIQNVIAEIEKQKLSIASHRRR